jgi:hypothetical protein
MGFGKKDDEESPRSDKFEATTKEQWKQITKRARKHDEEREADKAEKREKEKKRKRVVRNVDAIRAALAGSDTLDVRIFRDAFFEGLVKAIKENGGDPPAYHAFEELREVRDARFRFDLHLALARMSWMQHTRLIETAVGQAVPTRDWTEAWHAVCKIIKACFDIRIDKAGNERIKDRDALDDWPIPERKRAVKLSDEEQTHKRDVPKRLERASKMRKRKGKEGNMTLDMFEEDEKRRLLAARDDEDDDEEGDEEEDEEEDEDEESDDEDDEEDKKSKKSKKSKSEDDEDEDDEDDNEDETPRKRKKESKVSSKKKSDKSDKKDKKAKKEKVEKKSSSTSSGGDTFKTIKSFKTGIKAEVQKLIPAKGATLEQVVKAAKGAKLNKSANNIRSYLNWLAANGYLKRI